MPSTGQTHTILIVDDKERLRKGLARSLSREGCRTLTAASAEEALALSKERRIDLVITDLVMPGMDGMALIRKFKSAVPGIKTIIITAYGSAESMQEAEELGVACYLAKPFDLPHLKSRVNELLAGTVEGGRTKDEVRQTPGAEQFISARRRARLHPSFFIHRRICVAGGRTLRAAVDLSRRALPYLSPRKIVLGAITAAGKSIRRAAAATSGLARRALRLASSGRPEATRTGGGLASVFTRSGQPRSPGDQERPDPRRGGQAPGLPAGAGATKKEVNRE